jgi:hypothetical protein
MVKLLPLGVAIAFQFCAFAQPERLHIERSFPGKATGGIRAIASASSGIYRARRADLSSS